MGGLFGAPKPKTPQPPPPTPIPEVGAETGDYAAKMARKRKGYMSTVVTGSLAPKPSGKKTLLG